MLVETLNAIGEAVSGAIRQAAQATGTGFSYRLATAKVESGLDPNIKAPTSSATGLFQFIDQTWLMTMKQAGASLGYGRYAAAIEKTASGRYIVNDPALRAEILNLRKDPSANAAMAGALTRINAARLRATIGREPTQGELYIAHFLGAGGAAKLINAAANKPNASAAQLFPRAAAANRSIFYDKQGGARSVTGVYGLLVTKLARAMPDATPSLVTYSDAPPRPPAALPSPVRPATAPPTGLLAPVASAGAPLLAAQLQGSAPVGQPEIKPIAYTEGQPVFHDLFRTEGRGAVSQAVTELWGTASAPSLVAAPSALVSPSSGTDQNWARGFDLFRSPQPSTTGPRPEG